MMERARAPKYMKPCFWFWMKFTLRPLNISILVLFLFLIAVVVARLPCVGSFYVELAFCIGPLVK
jgi:hypothetical protein